MKKKSRERFEEIVKVFAKYGFGYVVDSTINNNKNSPKNFRKAIEELGPTFVKIGQILSTRDDILPKEYIDELVKLQDSVFIQEISVIKDVFEDNIGKKIEDSFKYFNEKPMASASMAQVYEAVLYDGRKVVVKIQRPNISETMKMDIAILKRIVRFTKINLSIVDPLDVLDEIEKSTKQELDFSIEGRNILKFKEMNKNVASVYAPDIIEEFLTKKTLVMEKIEGFKINDVKKIEEEGYDNKDVARKLALSYCKQIFEDGFFHGDPHPGNLLIYNGKICFIDFGIVGVLNENMKSWLNEAMISLATKDKEKIIEFILAVGIKKGKINKGSLYEDISYLFDTYLTASLKNIKIGVLLQEIFEIVKRNNIQLPSELSALIRGLVILEGVVAEVDPELEIISVVIGFVKSKNKLAILKELNQEELIISTYKFARDTMRIPSKTLELLTKINNDKANINFKISDVEKIMSNIDSMVNRLTGGLIVASLVISSSLIISNKVQPTYNGLSIIGIIGYGISFIIALIILVDMGKSTRDKSKKK